MNLFEIVFALLASGAALTALLICAALLAPAAHGRAKEFLEASLWRSFLLGLVNFFFFGALMAVLVQIAQAAHGLVAALLFLFALLDGLGLTLLLVLGLSALTTLVGERIGEEASPFRKHLRGAALVVLACATPWVGWFVFAPIVLLTGFGAAIQAAVRRK